MHLSTLLAPRRKERPRPGFLRTLDRLDADPPLLCGCDGIHGDGRECPCA
jgi:hypothetical protein